MFKITCRVEPNLTPRNPRSEWLEAADYHYIRSENSTDDAVTLRLDVNAGQHGGLQYWVSLLHWSTCQTEWFSDNRATRYTHWIMVIDFRTRHYSYCMQTGMLGLWNWEEELCSRIVCLQRSKNRRRFTEFRDRTENKSMQRLQSSMSINWLYLYFYDFQSPSLWNQMYILKKSWENYCNSGIWKSVVVVQQIVEQKYLKTF